MSIKQLPDDVVAQIKSSIAITSLNSVILGLVRNSLDATASKLNISVDYRKGSCSVEDNGLGIAPAEFLEKGGLGKLHYTSRYPPDARHYGSHGTFLASVAALSLLFVTSHHHEHRSHDLLSIHNSKVIARNTPAPPEQRLLAFPHGTRVTVRDLFGSMPVRVKQRALEMEKSGAARDFEQLVHGIIGLLLVWPDKASVTIRDAASSDVLSLRTKETRDVVDGAVLLGRTTTLLSQASLYSSSDANSWIEVGARGFGVSVRGCLCLVPTATKRLQFLAVGIKPLPNDEGTNVLYEEVNTVFINSAFGVIEGESDEDAPLRKEKRGSLRIKDLKARKCIDRWPIFALQIVFEDRPQKQYTGVDEILDGRSADLTVITNLLRALAYQFLKKHHFRPKPVNSILRQTTARGGGKGEPGPVLGQHDVSRPSSSMKSNRSVMQSRKHSGRSTSLGLRSVPELRSESPFDAWTRVRVGRPLSAPIHTGALQQPSPTQKTPLFDSTGKLLRKPFADDVPAPLNTQFRMRSTTSQNHDLQNVETDSHYDTVVWLDPTTNTRSKIDSRTGFVVNTDSTTGKRISLRPFSEAQGQTRPEPAEWIQEMMSDWQNPAYGTKEASIPRIPDPGEAAGQSAPGGISHNCGHVKFGDTSEESISQFTGRITKQALRDAEVISQVDSKFILVKVALHAGCRSTVSNEVETGSKDSGELLVLIDQHAADERCRVEELQKEYFASASAELGAHTSQLERPIQFELPSEEGLLLARFREHFEYWGIVYQVQGARTSLVRARLQQSKAKVRIDSLPPSILERCRLEPRLLIELVRKEAWRLREDPQLAVSARSIPTNDNKNVKNGWVSRFHGCPTGIVDLINSRSCRSAIMFNDNLSKEQCQDLVSRLAECSFPFQCAHGRPSMVPLVDLGCWADFGSVIGGESRKSL